MKRENWENESSRGLYAGFAIAAVILLVCGYVYLRNEENVWSRQALKQLENTSGFVALRVEKWLDNRLSEAREISQSPTLTEAVQNWLAQKEDEKLKHVMQQKLRMMVQSNPECVNILIADTLGNTLLAGEPQLTVEHTRKNIGALIQLTAPAFGKLYKSNADSAIYADIACPLIVGQQKMLAIIFFRVNPGVTLFPMLSDRSPGSTAESFLFEREGDSVVYLSNLRSRPNAALSLRIPLTNLSNPAVQAIKNGAGFYQGTGYHGQKVMEYIRPVSGTSWYLASKIDRDELFRPVHQRVKILAVILLLLFALLAAFVFLIINFRRKHYYQRLLEDEQQQAALKSHYEYVVKYANDIILLEDENLNIIEANQRAQQAYQYSLEELQKMKITGLVAPDSKQQVESRLTNITENDGAIIESQHRRKDGSLFYVEISARIIKVDGKKFLHQIIRDITERKQAEMALRESEERFRTTLYSTGDAIITTDLYGHIRYLNPVAEALTGWTEAEASGKPMREVFNIFNEDTGEEVESPVDKVLASGIIVMLATHTFLKSRDGREIPIGDSGAPIRDALGQISGAVLVFQNQTKEREAQQKIHESESHFHTLAEHSPVGIFRTRPDGYTTYVNPRWCQLSGLSCQMSEGFGWLDAVHPDDREKVKNGWVQDVEDKKVSIAEYRFLQPRGKIVYVLGRSVPEFDSDGNLAGYIGTITDITELKLSEEKIGHLNQLLRTIRKINQLITQEQDVKILIQEAAQTLTETQGYRAAKILLVNESQNFIMAAYHGLSEVTAHRLDALYQRGRFDNCFKMALRQAEAGVHKQGDEICLNCSVRDLHDANHQTLFARIEYNGIIYGALLVSKLSADENEEEELKLLNELASDIGFALLGIENEKKRLNLYADLVTAKERAQESDRLKSAFLATMSHELRTPLNTVIGFSSLIDEELPTEQIVKFAKMINNSGNNLLDIVEGILDLTLLESGQSKLHPEEFALLSFMETIYQLALKERDTAGKTELAIEYQPAAFSEPIRMYSDRQKIAKIFTHLIRNALKFTHSGKIELGFDILQTDHGEQVKFFVKDTGIGIAKEQKVIIFDRFRQAEDSFTRKYGGTGIGLTIAKRKAELLGGQIWVESEPGKGSSFWFTIPLTRPDTSQPAKPNEPLEIPKTFARQTVLVAEDENSNFELMKYMLIKSGLGIIRARNGKEAVELCSAHPEIRLILMDINMPDMNGQEATKIIKAKHPRVPVVAVTAFAMDGDRERLLSEGCDEYLEKPVKREKLFAMLLKFLS